MCECNVFRSVSIQYKISFSSFIFSVRMFHKLFLRNLQSLTRITQTSAGISKRAMQTNYRDYVKFLELVGNVKQLKRTGWVLRNVREPETVAAHMYRMSLLSFLIPESSALDQIKCMKLALIHDLAEAIVGDITPYCGIAREEKQRREHEAIIEISSLVPKISGEEILKLFEEYESQQTPESQWVKDCDRYDMIQQAFEYEKRDEAPMKHQEFFDNTRGMFRHPFFVHLVEELNKQREEYLSTTLEEKKNHSAS
ncbi:CLUMA_CG004522, isoform A [Clunio marinus]|uniref:5'-deoxynucleotidase HDDC2 n=1 Tax=Clunio marinus TaxID=568069 RepID=A0A1J1HRX4_9DIPT|nr:CLUMA_CG004522, isoform A [Clunio marinus]